MTPTTAISKTSIAQKLTTISDRKTNLSKMKKNNKDEMVVTVRQNIQRVIAESTITSNEKIVVLDTLEQIIYAISEKSNLATDSDSYFSGGHSSKKYKLITELLNNSKLPLSDGSKQLLDELTQNLVIDDITLLATHRRGVSAYLNSTTDHCKNIIKEIKKLQNQQIDVIVAQNTREKLDTHVEQINSFINKTADAVGTSTIDSRADHLALLYALTYAIDFYADISDRNSSSSIKACIETNKEIENSIKLISKDKPDSGEKQAMIENIQNQFQNIISGNVKFDSGDKNTLADSFRAITAKKNSLFFQKSSPYIEMVRKHLDDKLNLKTYTANSFLTKQKNMDVLQASKGGVVPSSANFKNDMYTVTANTSSTVAIGNKPSNKNTRIKKPLSKDENQGVMNAGIIRYTNNSHTDLSNPVIRKNVNKKCVPQIQNLREKCNRIAAKLATEFATLGIKISINMLTSVTRDLKASDEQFFRSSLSSEQFLRHPPMKIGIFRTKDGIYYQVPISGEPKPLTTSRHDPLLCQKDGDNLTSQQLDYFTNYTPQHHIINAKYIGSTLSEATTINRNSMTPKLACKVIEYVFTTQRSGNTFLIDQKPDNMIQTADGQLMRIDMDLTIELMAQLELLQETQNKLLDKNNAQSAENFNIMLGNVIHLIERGNPTEASTLLLLPTRKNVYKSLFMDDNNKQIIDFSKVYLYLATQGLAGAFLCNTKIQMHMKKIDGRFPVWNYTPFRFDQLSTVIRTQLNLLNINNCPNGFKEAYIEFLIATKSSPEVLENNIDKFIEVTSNFMNLLKPIDVSSTGLISEVEPTTPTTEK